MSHATINNVVYLDRSCRAKKQNTRVSNQTCMSHISQIIHTLHRFARLFNRPTRSPKKWWKEVRNSTRPRYFPNPITRPTFAVDQRDKGQEELKWEAEVSKPSTSGTGSMQWRTRRASMQREPRERPVKIKNRSLVALSLDHTTKVLASLVPDEIIYNVNDYSHRHYDCCLLFGDVSGKRIRKDRFQTSDTFP